jgi:hypothetical protein
VEESEGLMLKTFLFVNLVQISQLNVMEIFADDLFTFKDAYVCEQVVKILWVWYTKRNGLNVCPK